ncbi:MAG TPA: hypothetical protein VFN10_19515 [Thermoanaerobaculia bacterium]|nr:hypothetical protein [Thermoanaerobaculia bacterium]
MLLSLSIACAKSSEPAPDTGTTTTPITATTRTPNPPPVPDVIEHFKFWSVDHGTIAPPRAIDLRLPGGPSWPETVAEIPYLANPVQKNGKEIRDARKSLHYDAYQLHEAPAHADAHFYNQLTDNATWPLSRAAPLLLVPAIKSHSESGVADHLPSTPAYRHHYVCYVHAVPPEEREWIPVQDTKPRQVSLLDQFDTSAEQISRLQPAYFCFPVEKRYRTNPSEAPSHEVGLALYRIDPQRTYNQPVWTRDQFDKRELRIGQSVMLGVPSVWK